MSNSFYNHTTGAPVNRAAGYSKTIRDEFDAVVAGFTLVETLAPLLASGNVFAADNSFNGVSVGRGAYTTSDTNTRVGNGALGGNVSATSNTAFGYSALAGGLTGALSSNNTAAGANALQSLASGEGNTAVGSGAGYGPFGVGAATSGSNNTFVGYRAIGATATSSNAVTLGNSSVATLRCQVTSITSLSDARDKTAVRDLPHGLDFVNSLRPVEFTWNTRDGAKVGVRDAGFIAQELQAAQDAAGAAEALRLVYAENPEKLEASYGHLIPVLVKAIQDLSAKMEALQK